MWQFGKMEQNNGTQKNQDGTRTNCNTCRYLAIHFFSEVWKNKTFNISTTTRSNLSIMSFKHHYWYYLIPWILKKSLLYRLFNGAIIWRGIRSTQSWNSFRSTQCWMSSCIRRMWKGWSWSCTEWHRWQKKWTRIAGTRFHHWVKQMIVPFVVSKRKGWSIRISHSGDAMTILLWFLLFADWSSIALLFQKRKLLKNTFIKETFFSFSSFWVYTQDGGEYGNQN